MNSYILGLHHIGAEDGDVYTAETYSGLATAVRQSDPARAQRYIEEGLATGVTGGTRDSLLELQKQMSAAAPR